MSEDSTPTEYLIERFMIGPDVPLDGIAQWLMQVAANGFELVTAYGVPHPTTSVIVHHFVVQRRAGAEPQLSDEQRRELMLAELAGGGKLQPAAPAPRSKGRSR